MRHSMKETLEEMLQKIVQTMKGWLTHVIYLKDRHLFYEACPLGIDASDSLVFSLDRLSNNESGRYVDFHRYRATLRG